MLNKPSFNERKTTEAASYLLNMAGGRLRYILLIKLLYMADRKSLEEWGKPITFDSYASMKYGQVLSNTLNLVRGLSHSQSGEWEENIEAPVDDHFARLRGDVLSPKKLSRGEIEFLEWAYNEYRDKDPFEFTHELPEYVKTDFTSIHTPYERLLEVLGYEEGEIKSILSELHEKAEIESTLGS